MITMTISGGLTKDPELKTKGETKYCRLSVASSHYNGSTKQYDTDYVDVVLFGKQAEAAVKFLHKGSGVVITGSYESTISSKDPKKTFWTLIGNAWERTTFEKKTKPDVAVDDDLPFN